MHPVHVPDRAIVTALQAIDPHLSVAWIDGRWGVFDALQVTGNPEASVRAIGRELARDYRAAGYEVPYADCLRAATEQVERERLVCLVTEPDGSYRPLDQRLVDKFRRMAWFRRNFWAADYIRFAQQQSRGLHETRRRDADNCWQAIDRDRVFQRMSRDLVQGYHPVDSVSFSTPEVQAA